MDALNVSFWIGLAAAVPLSILGNVATRPIQSWLDRWSSDAPARKQRRLVDRLARALVAKEAIYRTTSIIILTVALMFFGFGLSAVGFVLLSLDPNANWSALLPWDGVIDGAARTRLIFESAVMSAGTILFAFFAIMLTNECERLRDVDDIPKIKKQLGIEDFEGRAND